MEDKNFIQLEKCKHPTYNEYIACSKCLVLCLAVHEEAWSDAWYEKTQYCWCCWCKGGWQSTKRKKCYKKPHKRPFRECSVCQKTCVRNLRYHVKDGEEVLCKDCGGTDIVIKRVV